MNRYLTALIALFVAAVAVAQEPAAGKPTPLDAKLEKIALGSLPVCSGATKLSQSPFDAKMPSGMSAVFVDVESEVPSCQGRFAVVTTSGGGAFVGPVWWIANETGETTEAKLTSFLWRVMQRNYKPVIEKAVTPYGTRKVTLYETTENGPMPMTGELDTTGAFFFFGHFRAQSADAAAERAKVFESVMTKAPSRGAGAPVVTIVEFSDFECPSCKRAAHYVDPILTKHGSKVRYVRMDLPLMSIHPWAFGAALYGRAIHRQKPEAFWDYKKQVYESQDSLTAFTIDRFAWTFAETAGLDMKKYEADVASQEVKDELLKGVGLAFSHDVRFTPTYMVNGVIVDAGDGAALASYVDRLISGK